MIDILEQSSLKEIILFLNRLRTKSSDPFVDVAAKVLDKLSNIMSLQYKQISVLLMEEYDMMDDKMASETLLYDLAGKIVELVT